MLLTAVVGRGPRNGAFLFYKNFVASKQWFHPIKKKFFIHQKHPTTEGTTDTFEDVEGWLKT